MLGFRLILAAILIYLTIEWGKLSGLQFKSLVWAIYLIGAILIFQLVRDLIRLRKEKK